VLGWVLPLFAATLAGAVTFGLLEAALNAGRMRLPIIAWAVIYPVAWSYQASPLFGVVVEGAVVLLAAAAAATRARLFQSEFGRREHVTPEQAAAARARIETAARSRSRSPATYRLVITRLPADTRDVIRLLRDWDGSLTDGQAKLVLSTLPVEIASGLTLSEATDAQRLLLASGVRAELR
jgi:hypothetical protein